MKYKKHLVFPSTSEVYGMCDDEDFDPEASQLVYGPINKPRWIYACSKQLMDRVIHAYGMEEGLNYTLFRPFNWIGAGLDSLRRLKKGSSLRGDAVPGPYRPGRADQAGRWRRPAARVRRYFETASRP